MKDTLVNTNYATAILTFAAGIALSFIISYNYKSFETAQRIQEVQSHNKIEISNIEKSLHDNLKALTLVKAFFDASSDITRHDFHVFASSLLLLTPHIQAIEWVPKVPHEQRELFVARARADGYEDFEFIEKDEDGNIIPTPKRDFYYPVYFLEPYEGNEIVLGLAPSKHKKRLDTIKKATETGRIVATPPLTLTQEEKEQRAILAFHAVYKPGAELDTLQKRHDNLLGLVLVALRISNIIEHILNNAPVELGVTITDVTAPQNKEIIFQNYERRVEAPYTTTKTINIANRVWHLQIYPINRSHNPYNKSYLIFALCMCVTLFVTYIIFHQIYRRKVIEKLVQKRTKEVQELTSAMEKTVEGVSVVDEDGNYLYANEAYTKLCGVEPNTIYDKHWLDIIAESDRNNAQNALTKMTKTGKAVIEVMCSSTLGTTFHASITLIKKTDEHDRYLGFFCFMSDITTRKMFEHSLQQANEELEEFAYRTSHDLRSPLVSSISLLKHGQKAIEEKDYKDSLECMNHAENALKKLDTLIGDILALTKAKASEEEDVSINIEHVIDNSLEKLSYMENFSRLTIKKDLCGQKLIKAKEMRVILIVENLISNAIKYQDKSKEQSYIHIKTFVQDNCFTLEIEDNGLGIPKEHRSKLFKMFQRFHNRTSFGSGLGLYMIKKSTEILNATIHIEHLTTGTRFSLNLPYEKT